MEETVKMDDKHRVILTKELREAAGIGEGENLVAIPFRGGVTFVSPEGKSFAGSLTGFGFREEKHEGTKFLMEAAGVARNRYRRNIRRSR